MINPDRPATIKWQMCCFQSTSRSLKFDGATLVCDSDRALTKAVVTSTRWNQESVIRQVGAVLSACLRRYCPLRWRIMVPRVRTPLTTIRRLLRQFEKDGDRPLIRIYVCSSKTTRKLHGPVSDEEASILMAPKLCLDTRTCCDVSGTNVCVKRSWQPSSYLRTYLTDLQITFIRIHCFV